MTKADVGAVAARTLALFILLHSLPAAVLMAGRFEVFEALLLWVVFAIIYLVMAGALWRGSAWLGERFAGPAARQSIAADIDPKALQRVAFAVLGLFILAFAVTDSLSGQALGVQTPELGPGPLFVDVLRLAAALILIVGAERVMRLAGLARPKE